MSRLRELCKRHTGLTDEDIVELNKLEEFLAMISEASDGDVFIDCKTRNPNVAIVVAEHRKEKSLYKETVVGKFAFRENEPAALRTLDTGIPTRQLNGISQENVPIEQSTTAVKNNDRVIGVLIIEKDITRDFIEKNSIERAATLMPSESLHFKDLREYVIDGLLIFDETGHLVYCNSVGQELYRNLGYRDSIIGMDFKNLALEDISYEDILKEKFIESADLTIGEYYLTLKYSLLSSDNKVMVLIRDLTELKTQQQELISKSVVIQEIHHRVKNNLQTIASLMRMQSRRVSDPRLKTSYQESINRILSIAVTHEILAQDISGTINVHEMIARLIQNTIYEGVRDDKVFTIDVEGDSVVVDSKKATLISLIVNELLSNAFEHAFKNRQHGKVRIVIEQRPLVSSIQVIDDGEGFDPDKACDNCFGLSIVQGLVKESLQGDVDIESGPEGTRVSFTFLND